MEKSLVRTGTFFAIAFALALAYVIVSGLALGKTVLEIITYSGFWICLVLSLAMYASTRVSGLRYFQPLLLVLLTIYNIITTPDPYTSTIFAVAAFILFYLAGFFEKRRVLKFFLLVGFYYGLMVFQAFSSDFGGFFAEETRPKPVRGFGVIIPITIFLLFLVLAFKERLTVYLKEPKPVLSLSGKGLTGVESGYFRGIVGGKSFKEVAVDYEVSESTVRNTMARVYKKLGVLDKTELMLLAAASEITD